MNVSDPAIPMLSQPPQLLQCSIDAGSALGKREKSASFQDR